MNDKEIMEIEKELNDNPEMLEYMKICMTLTKEQKKELLKRMERDMNK